MTAKLQPPELLPAGPNGTGGQAALHPTRPEPAPRRDARPAIRRRAGRFAWSRRRAPLILAGLAAGLAGGAAAAATAAPHYSATGVVVVQAGAPTAVTASANGATQLATTYAALIPQDQALTRSLAKRLGVSDTTADHMVSVQAVAGTALIDVKVAAASPQLALAGASNLVRALTSPAPPGGAIVPGSVSLVTSPRRAVRSGGSRHDLIVLAPLLGLIAGGLAALVAERVDRRVDRLTDLSGAAECPATRYPSGLPLPEIVQLLRRTGAHGATVLPLRRADEDVAGELAYLLSSEWGAPEWERRPPVSTSCAFEVGAVPTDAPPGATVLVVSPGEKTAEVEHAVSRLALADRRPGLAVLSGLSARTAATDAQDLVRAPRAVRQWAT